MNALSPRSLFFHGPLWKVTLPKTASAGWLAVHWKTIAMGLWLWFMAGVLIAILWAHFTTKHDEEPNDHPQT